MAGTGTTTEGIQPPATGKYELDPAHTAVEFVARHILTKVRGRFTKYDGHVTIGEKLEDSSVHVDIDAGSITTDSEMRDQHLRSGDFFETESNPTLTFRSTGFRVGEGKAFELDGDLTIRGVTKPVTLQGELLGWGPSPQGGTVVGARPPDQPALVAPDRIGVEASALAECGPDVRIHGVSEICAGHLLIGARG